MERFIDRSAGLCIFLANPVYISTNTTRLCLPFTFRSLSEMFVTRSLDEDSYTVSHTYDRFLVTSLPWQEPEEELNKLLPTKVSDRDRNITGK